PEYKGCHLLYYTGITRTAKQILAEIVRGMFLNSSAHLDLLDRIRAHAGDMARAIRRCDFDAYCRLLAVSRELNGRLDAGTEPPAIKAIIDRVSDYIAACKMPGAGGGGFIYMVARDPEAAAAIKRRLTADPPNPRARFVDMELSSSGLVVSRS
ncbi:MAG: bifunctional fucokinase/L-fucose-1-P-guanylyltransferase, partial [Paramuribaculum sp.]|nr:bifunctional fucokinase/L-fucose-1-P-guanylyltransferase [Paramuribaculum sp.]